MKKNKVYTFKDLLEQYDMYDLNYENYGNNENGTLLLYVKTDTNKVSVFTSIDKQTKYEYLNFNDEEKSNLRFKFLKEVDMKDLNFYVYIGKSSSTNIVGGDYTVNSLEKLIQEEENKTKPNIPKDQIDGFLYTFFDNDSGIPLFTYIYTFGSGGLMKDIKENVLVEFKNQKNKLLVDNVESILKVYDETMSKSDFEKDEDFSK